MARGVGTVAEKSSAPRNPVSETLQAGQWIVGHDTPAITSGSPDGGLTVVDDRLDGRPPGRPSGEAMPA